MPAIVVTGAAGFIGSHVAMALLERGERVIGVDDLNDYYDVALKRARLARLEARDGFSFLRADIADRDAMLALADGGADTVERIVHLAAQAGVRYSLVNPYAYVHANMMGHLVMLELARALPKLRCMVYASSSSVYGGNVELPFAVSDRVDNPISLYAASKRADELMSQAYANLYGLALTGLRFFTVYGPWGRPDMAAYIFTRAILAGEPIQVFNNGDMRRDFTYIDDITAGVLGALDAAAVGHRLYNLGNHKSEPLMRLIALLEHSLGRKAEIVLAPMQAGDVKETYAEISAAQRDFGFQPKTPIDKGAPLFVDWYKSYHNVRT